MLFRLLKWLAALLLTLPLLAFIWVAIFGWNWARAPLQQIVLEQTGRALLIGGDLKLRLEWPAPRVSAKMMTFANPPWAAQRQMLAVDEVEFTVDLLALLGRSLVFPEVRLKHPVVFLEQAPDGRKTWLLDLAQSDETALIPIGRLTLDQGLIGFDDAKQKTRIRVAVSTQDVAVTGEESYGLVFAATGILRGLELVAKGTGGSVMALYDERVPYHLKVDATIGRTGIQADGQVTSLLKLTALDMQLAVRGDSLAQLFPLLGIALPQTHAYATTGRIVHDTKRWRFEKFTGHFGKSDLAGTLQVDLAGPRPLLKGELSSKRLDMADLGPVIGAADKRLVPTHSPVVEKKVLPNIPFKAERWNTVDADVSLRAATLARAKELPLEDLVAHLKMQDAVLTLDPMDFGVAGGHLKASITLDGRQMPIRARAKIDARKIALDKLFPTVEVTHASVGQINGQFDLTGQGNSVGDMLASSDGRVALVVVDGQISKLLMEKLGLHLLEILQLKLMGDKTIKLRCGVADFGVKAGVMDARALVLDTEISTIIGSGQIDLAREQLDLTLVPKTRNTSLVALRSPIHVVGSFANPLVQLDTGRVVVRGLGAVGLGLVNPLLALLALVEMGPGVESHCKQLIADAKMPQNGASAATPVK